MTTPTHAAAATAEEKAAEKEHKAAEAKKEAALKVALGKAEATRLERQKAEDHAAAEALVAAEEEKAAKAAPLPEVLKPGDKVKLKGMDGPVLTIQDIHGKDAVCHWFGTSGDYNRTSFHVDALEPAEKPPAKPEMPTGHGPHVTK